MSQSTTSCPVSYALERVGDRWATLILRDLLLNPSRRFQDLQDSLTGCAPSTLSSRLKAMEKQGLLCRRQYAEHPPRFEYVLTETGRGAAPVLMALRSWGTALQSADDVPAAAPVKSRVRKSG